MTNTAIVPPTIVTPNMNLVIPDIGYPSYLWADLLNAVFQKIDSHNHDLKNQSGVFVNINSVVITDYFGVQNNAIFSGISGLEFLANSGILVNNSLNTDTVNLYFQDGYGTNIQLTSNGDISYLLLQGPIYGDYASTSANATYNMSTQTYSWYNSSGVLAPLMVDMIFATNLNVTSNCLIKYITILNNLIVNTSISSSASSPSILLLDSKSNYSYPSHIFDDWIIPIRDANGNIPFSFSNGFGNVNVTNYISFSIGVDIDLPTATAPYLLQYQINKQTGSNGDLRVPYGKSTFLKPNSIMMDNSSGFKTYGSIGSCIYFNATQAGTSDDYVTIATVLSDSFSYVNFNSSDNAFPISIIVTAKQVSL